MSVQMQIPGGVDLHVAGHLSAKTLTIPSGTLTDAGVNASAAIAATKLIHQHPLRHSQKAGTAVTAETIPIHVFRGDAEIVAVELVPITPPAGGDLAYSVDVQLGNASTAFATILTAPIAVDSGDAARTPIAGTLSDSDAADGDTLQVVVAVSGSTGTQGQGFCLVVWVREEP